MAITRARISHVDTNETMRYILGGCNTRKMKKTHFIQQ